jgi:hypothetical protein
VDHWSGLYDDQPVVIGESPFAPDLDNDPIPKRRIGRKFLVVLGMLALLGAAATAGYVYHDRQVRDAPAAVTVGECVPVSDSAPAGPAG